MGWLVLQDGKAFAGEKIGFWPHNGDQVIGEVVFNGITKHHLELLCFSLGLDGSFPLRAGGNKAGYFGLLNVEVIESTCYASGNYNHPSIQMDKRVKVDWFEPCKLAALYGKDNHNIMGNIRKLREILNRRCEIFETERIDGIGQGSGKWKEQRRSKEDTTIISVSCKKIRRKPGSIDLLLRIAPQFCSPGQKSQFRKGHVRRYFEYY